MNLLLDKIDRLSEIGTALSAEQDTARLLELIMLGAKSLTCADGGSLYFVKEKQLKFEIISNDTLAIRMGGTSGNHIEFSPIPLYLDDGQANHNSVVSHCVLTGKTVNIEDAYNEDGFDFAAARQFDDTTGYRTRSVLTVPLKNHEQDIIGVLQLINAMDTKGGDVISFSQLDQRLAESLASQAAVALTQKRLLKELKDLFESFTKMIANAIDDKSPYTGGHCRRIPVLTMMLAEAVNQADEGPLQTFHIDDDDRYELETAAWLHDCGKVVTPEYVMDKSTKLEGIFDRIHLIEHRIEILLRDREIDYLKQCQSLLADHDAQQLARQKYEQDCQQLKQDLAFLQQTNFGSEYMSDDDIDRVNRIARHQWVNHKGQVCHLLEADELLNLSIRKGTLNEDERAIINHHIVATINMLEALPFPKKLRRVPEYAGGHHEKMDGSGYPKGLKGDEMSVQTRIMAIADIFEALTARDRPYKKGKTLSECLEIMSSMKKEHHIDPDIFDIFIRSKVYLKYAEEFLDPRQIDTLSEAELAAYLD